MNAVPPPHPLETPPERRHPLEQGPQPPERPRQQIKLRFSLVRPRVTVVLIAINVLIFVVRALSPALDESLLVWGANSAADVLGRGEYYRLFTSMFLHAGIYNAVGGFALESSIHILGNMYVLYAVGNSLEALIGHARFAILYVLGGLTGSIFSALLGGAAYSIGASGAVFAILGAEFVFLYHHRKLMGEAGRARRNSLIGFAILNLLIGLVSTLPGSRMRIDNWAHAGGLVGGLILMWFISPIFTLRAHPEAPGDFRAEDINPLRRSRWIVSVYAAGLVVVVFVSGLLARG
jgi:rhomboid protease GluP